MAQKSTDRAKPYLITEILSTPGLETVSCVTTAIPRDMAGLMDDGQEAPNCGILSLAVISRLLCIYKVIVESEERKQTVTTEDSGQNRYFLKKQDHLGLIELVTCFNCNKKLHSKPLPFILWSFTDGFIT